MRRGSGWWKARASATLGLVVLACSFGGCGGSGADGALTGGGPLAPPGDAAQARSDQLADFYARADGICEQALRRLAAVARSNSSVVHVTRVGARIQRDSLTQLESLAVPSGIQRDYRGFLRSMRRRNVATRQLATLLATNQPAKAGKAGTVMNTQIRIAKRWGARIGFATCPNL